MSEYIDRDAALVALQDSDLFNTTERQLRAIRELPAADVAVVVQGSGKLRATEEAETTQIIDGCCTACGALMDCCEAAEYKYCPMCGRKFRRDK